MTVQVLDAPSALGEAPDGRRRKLFLLWGAGLLALSGMGTTAIVYAVAASNGSGSGTATTNGNGGSAGAGNPGHPITLTGSVVGTIKLGAPSALNVTINNPNNQEILVTSVTGAVTSVSSAGVSGRPVCSAGWYSVGTFAGTKSIAKNASGVVSVPITLTNLTSTNQDNCKGQTLQFTFTAQAQQA